MGYYSEFEYQIADAIVNKDKAEELEKFFSNDGGEDVFGFYGVRLVIGNRGKLQDISLEDTYAKFYDDRLFAHKLSDALVSGTVFLYFYGEDGGAWGYKVTPGKVEEMDAVFLDPEEQRLLRLARKWQPYLEKLEAGFIPCFLPPSSSARKLPTLPPQKEKVLLDLEDLDKLV